MHSFITIPFFFVIFACLIVNMLYPLKFIPVYKTPIWGGKRISGFPGRKNVPAGCGESWEISTVENNVSVVANGFLKGNTLEEVIEVYMADLLGEKVYEEFGLHFPLLVKIIDAADDLSVQVHPGDEYALQFHQSSGKTEMWYVMQAEKGAAIINGFSRETTSEEVQTLINEEKLPEVLNKIPAKAGDVHFIPSGRVHAIGRGVMLAEIQQASDITYRLYDWGRKDEKGNGRQLHIDNALDVLDFSADHSFRRPVTISNESVNIAKCDYFTTNILSIEKSVTRNYLLCDSFVILLCTSGKCSIHSSDNSETKLNTGETVLIPASVEVIEISSEKGCKLIECYIE